MTTRKGVNGQVNNSLRTLRALGEEIRHDIETAGIQANRQWKKLEPALKDVEKFAGDVSDASIQAIQDTAKRVSEFREMLRGFGHSERVVASHLFLQGKTRSSADREGPLRRIGSGSIRRYMTRSPHTIAVDRTLADAHTLMRQYRIRHLPVLEHGKLVGIVSERDLHLVETLRDVNPAEVTVEEAMSQDVFSVDPGSSMARVARRMAERKVGSAVVVNRDEVLGIFSTVDALRALADLSSGTRTRKRAQPKPTDRARG